MSLKSISIPTQNAHPVGVIVSLHGSGSNCYDLPSLVPLLNLPEYHFEFPDAPFPHHRVPGGKMWYNLTTKEYQGLAESREMLKDWLVSLESKTGIPLSGTFLVGFSQGGAMTLDVGLSFPFAGLISLSGYLHSEPQPSIEVLPPTLIVHGKQDMVVPLAAAVRSRDTFTALGASVEYREFDMGHEIQPEVMDLMRSFVVQIMSKVD
ncbi:serine esterase [Oscillatoriales cyanobacterium USR001]|nr:serine esterase [Oscillatoriales cyanobacterium USR001]